MSGRPQQKQDISSTDSEHQQLTRTKTGFPRVDCSHPVEAAPPKPDAPAIVLSAIMPAIAPTRCIASLCSRAKPSQHTW